MFEDGFSGCTTWSFSNTSRVSEEKIDLSYYDHG